MAFGVKFNAPTENNSFEGKGIRSLAAPIANAAAITVPVPTRKAYRHLIDFATLTQATTINFTDVTGYEEGDEIWMAFVADATGRTITWGTNVRPGVASTFALTSNQVGLVQAVFLNSKLHILDQTAGAA